ncbi:hypothetical protein IGI04_018400 [Brassica rapa subsp. trilocularis]|uniref:Uncharacterized protein n=1 Tax=Brassica rapa subsp. trilocularis TaxID=1813537 RepID=A0ABQ7MCV1_BRACM|nr:hypothetical protein IGI04_018400 [Brassica rapa subsp. trilocularis]
MGLNQRPVKKLKEKIATKVKLSVKRLILVLLDEEERRMVTDDEDEMKLKYLGVILSETNEEEEVKVKVKTEDKAVKNEEQNKDVKLEEKMNGEETMDDVENGKEKAREGG